MRILPSTAFAVLSVALHAQTIAGSFAPNPVAPGVPVTLTCTDSTGQGVQLSSPCGWFAIHQHAQNGAQVQLGLSCPAVIVPVAPNGTFQFTWNQRDGNGVLVPADTYWFQVHVWDSGFASIHEDWFCISIQPANAPALTAAGPARVGRSTALQIAASQQPGALYIAAASFSSNTPASFFGLSTCLSVPLFLDPILAPIGVLDGSGNSTGMALGIPNVPVALYLGLHVQALLSSNSGLALTNDLSFTIQP